MPDDSCPRVLTAAGRDAVSGRHPGRQERLVPAERGPRAHQATGPNRNDVTELAEIAREITFRLMRRLTLLLALLCAGCGHSLTVASPSGRSRHIGDLEQKVLAVGPTLLTHIGTAGDGTLFVYSAPVRSGRDDDCELSDSELESYLPIAAGVGQDVNITVPSGEVACAAVAMGMGVDVTWMIAPITTTASR